MIRISITIMLQRAFIDASAPGQILHVEAEPVDREARALPPLWRAAMDRVGVDGESTAGRELYGLEAKGSLLFIARR